jgi:hypothetical protein
VMEPSTRVSPDWLNCELQLKLQGMFHVITSPAIRSRPTLVSLSDAATNRHPPAEVLRTGLKSSKPKA